MIRTASISGILFCLMSTATQTCGTAPEAEPLLSVQVTDASAARQAQTRGTMGSNSEPTSYEHVYVTVDEVSVLAGETEESGVWTVIASSPQTLDLITLANGSLASLGVAELGEGSYSQIRLLISESSVVVEGTEYPCKIPSGSSSGLKIQGAFTMSPDVVTSVTLDFDASESISYNKGQGYMMSPVVKLLSVTYSEAATPPEPPGEEVSPPVEGDDDTAPATPELTPDVTPSATPEAPSSTPEVPEVTPTSAPSGA